MGDMISNGYKSKLIIITIIYRRGFSVTDDESIKIYILVSGRFCLTCSRDKTLSSPDGGLASSGSGDREGAKSCHYPTLDAGDSAACGGLQGGRRWMP